MAKDGCNNMEKNKILRYHDDGIAVPDIARALRLTERIVNSIIGHYRPEKKAEPESKPKAKKKPKKKAKAKKSAAEDFE